jgi:fibronectin type 3 domain-containing protein
MKVNKPWLPIAMILIGAMVVLCSAATAQSSTGGIYKISPAKGAWPSAQAQLAKDRIIPGSALERLVLQNQDFSLLRAEEANDRLRFPPWLRVLWRKNHPQDTYPAKDPTGGYPLVLNEIYEWMLTHQDLKPGSQGSEVMTKSASETSEQNISGNPGVPRSESDIRINPFTPSKIIGASNNIGGNGEQAIFFSSNTGATWGQTQLPLVLGDSFHSDPTVDWTSDGTAWSTTIGIDATQTVLTMRAYKSTNGGASWTFDNTFSNGTNNDKELIWVDKTATSPCKDNIYAIWHNGLPAIVNHRTGPGGAWQTPIQVSGAETTGTGIGGDITSDSAGNVFAFWPDTGSQGIYVAKSTNCGSSFGTPVHIATTFDSFQFPIPSNASRMPLIYASAGTYKNGATNNVYVTWNDLASGTGCGPNDPGTNASSPCKSRIWFSRSTDGGSTWSTATMINNQSGLNDQFFNRLTVDPTSGKVSVVYYDTVGDSTRLSTNVYYQASTDGGLTWSTPFKVTSASTNETTAGADSGNQYGDYIGMSGYNGTFFPSWTDRRGGGNEQIWSANISDGACTPPAAPTGLTATANGQNGVNLSWNTVSGATYHIFRSTTSGGPYTQVGSSSTTSFSDTGLTCNTSYFYVVRAFTSCESANSSQASATTATCTCTPPPVPTGLSATANGQTAANLSWSASTGATSYNVLRSTTSGGPYTQIGTSTTTTFADSGLTCNTTYFYVVQASNGSCASGNSSQASTTTAACGGCTTTTQYSNNFETGSGLSDWTKGTFVAGGSTVDWRGIQTCTANSGTHIFRFGGSSCTTNYGSNRFTFAQPKGATGIAIPAGATKTRLSFFHRRSFESGFDGGTLAVSVNGTNYFFVPASAIISGASYNNTIAPDCPPAGSAGASVFSGSQSTFVNTTVDLDAACNVATGLTTGCAGRSVYIAFTSISDCSVTFTGWFLDDVVVTDCQ